MRVVVSGATSFIGKHFIDLLIEKSCEVVAVVRRNSRKAESFFNNPLVDVVEMDMLEYSRLGEVVGRVDCFVHLAWDGTRGVDRSDKDKQEKNFYYSIEAIKSMIKNGCRRIILAGSQAEYGNHSGIITENSLSNPNTEYGKNKLKLFEKAQDLCRKNKVALKELRFFSIYGKGDFNGTLIMSTIDKMLNNETCRLTECIQLWNFVYIKDVVNAIYELSNCDCSDGVYNIASEDTRTLRDYLTELKKILKSSSKLEYGAIPYPSTGVVNLNPSIEKIQKETKWRPCTTFEQGILEIVKQRGV